MDYPNIYLYLAIATIVIAVIVVVVSFSIEEEGHNEIHNLIETANCNELLTMIQDTDTTNTAIHLHNKWISDKCWKV